MTLRHQKMRILSNVPVDHYTIKRGILFYQQEGFPYVSAGGGLGVDIHVTYPSKLFRP